VNELGRTNRPGAAIKKNQRSIKVIPFARGASYYARKGAYYSQKNKPSKALLYLRKAVETEPEDPFNHYNLACLLSKLNHFKEANRIFDHIVSNMDAELTECYFFMAVNHGLMEDLDETRRLLIKYLENSPSGDMAEEAETLLFALESESEGEAFNHGPDTAESEALMEMIDDLKKVQFKDLLLEEKNYQQTLRWGLYQGGDLIKEAILLLYGEAGGQTAKDCLAEFVANPWISERLRYVALQELKKINPAVTCRIFTNEGFLEVRPKDYPPPAPIWEGRWQQVLESTFANMRRSSYYSEEFYDDAEAIWVDFINRIYPLGPHVKISRTWAAGLEYCLARFHYLGITQKELAAAYGVSVSSVHRKFNEINSVLQIDRKAYRNMLALMTNEEEKQL